MADEKSRRRKMLVDAITESSRRRPLRLFGDDLKDVEDPEERAAEAKAPWKSPWMLSWFCVQWRVNS